ncbi:MAG: Phosphatidylserine decarboxylase proenzyme 2 [Chlamydiales bacterium]|nr:Phosphatidylserine decarboxylase proenzyme 2 [Chlamydiales bacterium]
MNKPIRYLDRQSGELRTEKVYCEPAIRFLYGSPFGRFFARIVAGVPLFSKLYGWWQSLPLTKGKIAPFVKKFELDPGEFELPLSAYSSFNAFFTRKLKPEARPIGNGLILPADGRYFFYQNIETCDGFVVKGKKFSLEQILGDRALAHSYASGSMILARLCPTDYHRFHFPCDCTPGPSRLINGPLYSVNPLATRERIDILAENKRMITHLQTKERGEILFIEVGATNVGSIHQTFTANQPYQKGDEKGFFSFGGSSLILLFQSDQIQIDPSLLTNSSQGIETLCLFGQTIESVK